MMMGNAFIVVGENTRFKHVRTVSVFSGRQTVSQKAFIVRTSTFKNKRFCLGYLDFCLNVNVRSSASKTCTYSSNRYFKYRMKQL